MIDDLDKTLHELLRQELPKTIVDQVTVSFVMPDDQFPPSSVKLPAIDLFLYDVRENRELRSNEWLSEQGDGGVVRRPPPLRIDCSYLITAWASQSSSTPAYDEHHLLGEVLRVISRFSSLPAAILQGGLKGQIPPLPAAALQPGLLQSIGEFWQALGGKPKVALNYTVTIGLETAEAIRGTPVVDKIISIGGMHEEEESQ